MPEAAKAVPRAETGGLAVSVLLLIDFRTDDAQRHECRRGTTSRLYSNRETTRQGGAGAATTGTTTPRAVARGVSLMGDDCRGSLVVADRRNRADLVVAGLPRLGLALERELEHLI